jgi:outer membrane protein
MRKGMLLMLFIGVTASLPLGGGRAQGEPLKIGFVDLQRVMETSERGKQYREKLFEFRREREKILAAKQEELNRLGKEFQQKAFTMSDRARLDREQELRQKELEFKNLSEAYRQEILMEGQKLRTLMFREIQELIKKIGKKEGFHLILREEVVLYGAKSIDLTDKVIKAYNAQVRKPSSKGK